MKSNIPAISVREDDRLLCFEGTGGNYKLLK